MKVKVIWLENMQFKAESGSGHSFIFDASPDIGGENKGVRPMEALLMSMAGCSAMDVIFILKKSRQEVTDCQVSVDGSRAKTAPKVFTNIHVHYQVSGVNMDPAQVKRAVELSAGKYCSVAAMIKKSANVTYDYSIV